MKNLVDMKIPKKSKKELREEMAVGYTEEQDRYPYGLQLRFDKEQIKKIGALQKIQAGATVNIVAVGKVTEVRITDAEGDRKRHNVEIQIQKINVADTGSYKESFKEALGKE